ncbi:MAG: 50S ribosomal protein L25/general stress protein Ctc [Betaproteobacteria bacterium]|nr:50S ribosomal protein L25/general stress protein Ctc [Betaproteobacteria bacterium]
MKIELSAKARDGQGTGASRRLRRTGMVPGILYGGNQPAQGIQLDHNDLYQHLRQEAFHASILTMNLDGAKQQVLLRDVHMHPFRAQVMHVDFQRVARDRKIHMKVPLHFKNAEIAPGVKVQGGMAQHVLNELDIVCLPDDLPEFIEVDLANLSAGHSLHLADLTLPKGVEVVAVLKRDNPVVATIVIPKVITEEEEAAPAVEASAVPTTAQKTEAEKAAEAEKKEGEKPAKSEKKG